MDVRWQEEQRAFQARVLIDENPDVGLRPYRTFIGHAAAVTDLRTGRAERLMIVIVTGAVVVSLVLAVGFPRELAALAASFAGGAALMIGISPMSREKPREAWTPLLAVYAPAVRRGDTPLCVTQISPDEFERLGIEGFGTIVGNPRPGATFGLFVDEHLVWPRTPPRGPQRDDPGFGTA
jgi:hypothetical protein